MKFLVVLAITVACANAQKRFPASILLLGKRSVDSEVPIVRSSFDSTPEGNFQYEYETGNGITAQVEGVVKDANTDKATLGVRGTFKYTSPDGTPVEQTWTADENGFVAYGSHLPVAPEIPEGILRGLQYIRDHPPPVERVFAVPQ